VHALNRMGCRTYNRFELGREMETQQATDAHLKLPRVRSPKGAPALSSEVIRAARALLRWMIPGLDSSRLIVGRDTDEASRETWKRREGERHIHVIVVD
jgi:hypothetical protein